MKRKVSFIVALLTLALLLFVPLLRNRSSVEAAQPQQLLGTARGRIQEARPGELVHVAYAIMHRPPPTELEPTDPYHLPYSEAWPAQEFEDTWIEIGADGVITRWRTQLRNSKGELLQDLLFDNGIETDYFPRQGWASRFEQTAGRYRDERLVLIEDFLARDNLTRRENVTTAGQGVQSVYTARTSLENASAVTVPEALIYQERPFVADLALESQALRIDFDQATGLPVGEAQVGWDASGVEHVLSYRAFLNYEVLSAGAAETLFEQQIPTQAFSDTGSAAAVAPAVATNLEQLSADTEFPVYVIQDQQLQPDQSTMLAPVPQPLFDYMTDNQRGAALGLSLMETVYTDDTGGVLTVLQGTREDVETLLAQRRATWHSARTDELPLGDQDVTVWILTGLDESEGWYVVETWPTTLFLHSQELTQEQVWTFLQSLQMTKD